MKQVIINADDFGMSKEVNEGTKKGIKEGVITSVSVMVNMPYFDDAIEFLKKNPNISVGLHFNLTEGAPVLKPSIVPHLLREDDSFFYWTPLITKVVLNRKEMLPEIEAELEAQYNKLKKTGLKITHIDSHHHIHLFPSILRTIFPFTREHKINDLRVHAFNIWNLHLGVRKMPTMTQAIVNSFLLFDNMIVPESKENLHIDRFFDVNWVQEQNGLKFEKVLANLPQGKTEFICHLAVSSKSGNQKFLSPRENTLNLLRKPAVKKRLLKNGITLINRESGFLAFNSPTLASVS